jgi:hypothetical protein
VRLKRLEWERHQYLLRALTRTRLRPDAARHEPPATSTSNLGSPFEPADNPPAESEAERKDRELQAAYEYSMAIVAAGKAMGARRRQLGDMAVSRVPDPVRIGPRLTIAPWLYEREHAR